MIARSATTLLSGLLAIALSTPAAAQMPASEPTFAYAEAFIDATYSDVLAGSSWQYQATADGAYRPPSQHWGIGIQLFPYGGQATRIENDASYRRVPLHVILEWWGGTGPPTMTTAGQLVNSGKNQSFAAVVTQHREWSRPMVIEQLRQRGANFTDPEEVARALPLHGWSPLLGYLRILEIQLDVPEQGPRDFTRRLGCLTYWDIVLIEPSSGQKYHVMAEPFGGKVTRMAPVPDEFELREIR